MSDIDRVDAEVFAGLLQVPVEVIPEDGDVLSRELWEVLLGDKQMPENVDVRWQILLCAWLGMGTL